MRQSVSRVRFTTVFLIVLIGSAGRIEAAPILFGLTHFSNQLITINPTTGAGTLVGVVSPTDNLRSLGLASLDGALYTYAILQERLLQLNPADGSTLASINLGLGVAAEGGLAFAPDGTGILGGRADGQAVGTQSLWSFNLAPPSNTLITSALPPTDGLDFGPTGTLFTLTVPVEGASQYQLHTVNPATGVTTLVGGTGVFDTGFAVGGLSFSSDGTLYGVMNDNLYGLNTATGAATLIGPTGFLNIAGLTEFEAAAPIPEPSTLVLLGLGLAKLARSNRRRVASAFRRTR